MKKIVLSLVIFMSMIFLTACVSNNETQNMNEPNASQEAQAPGNDQPQGPPPEQSQPPQNQEQQGAPSFEVISEEGNTRILKAIFPDGNVVKATEKTTLEGNGNRTVTRDLEDGTKEIIKYTKISDNKEKGEGLVTHPDGGQHKYIEEVKINKDGSREIISHKDI